MRRVAVVGAGLAGLSAGLELRRLGFDGELVLVGAEPHRPYRRPPLSKEYLLGAVTDADLALPGADGLGACWLLGAPVTGLDLAGRRLLRGGRPPVRFDGLVVATGVRPRRLAGSGDLRGVVTLRGLDDARELRAALAARPRVVVAGGGFLGSEVAASLRALDLPVTLVESGPVPLHRPLGGRIGALVADLHRAHGVDLRLRRRVVAVAGAGGRVRQVRLDGGEVLSADLLVVALGAEPEVGWLRGSGLRLDRGVVVGAGGLAAPGVAAAGDVARWPAPLLGGRLVAVQHHGNAVDQGGHAARVLLGAGGTFDPVPTFWCHLYGHRLQSVGFTGADHRPTLVLSEPDGRFLAEYRGRDGRLVGAVTAGFVHRLPHYHRRLSDRE